MSGKLKPRTNTLNRLQSGVSRLGVDALLITDQRDIEYLSGIVLAGRMLLVVAKKGHPILFVDNMNRALAESMPYDSGVLLCGSTKPALKSFALHVKDRGFKRIGVQGEDLSLSDYRRIERLVRGVKLVPELKRKPAGSIIKEMRQIKGEGEIELLREAARRTVRIWKHVERSIKPGLTEQEIARMVDLGIREKGQANSFTTIAAAGENSAYPHAVPGKKRVKRGEVLLVDFGMRFQGYCSDLTRVWYKGRINRQIRDFHGYVRKGLDSAIKSIKPGLGIGTLVSNVNRVLLAGGNADFILHGLGHGVGLDVHEEPFLRKGSRLKFRKGMVITIEPGLYKNGLGGIREEEMVLVTSRGCEVLTV